MVGRQHTSANYNCFGQALNLFSGITGRPIQSKVIPQIKEKEKYELSPSEYAERKLNASKLVNNESPQKGTEETKISEQDKETPDDWVPRSDELIRLVGKHPFNCEANLTQLVNEGLITPNRLHYVRNHGEVPRIIKEEHKLIITGMVDTPTELTVEDIKKLPWVNFPTTLTCDGNRRKEVNVIKKSTGFNWGAGGTSCAYWKGAYLCDILKACGIHKEAKYVWFEGTETLAKGKYGTSIPLRHCMDETNDVIVAYEMNNDTIPPDHGYPLRLVTPGFVGGRQIKWLREIRLSDKETENYYHWHDNKVMPPHVLNHDGPEWRDPGFTLYELNIQSTISNPANAATVTLDNKGMQRPITFEGYAYSGGGRKVNRVEITLDGGKTWILAKNVYPAGAPRHDTKYWTWCHWMVNVESWKVMRCSEVAVRAFDASCNTQPAEPTWNLLGMMNNAWFRVKVELQESAQGFPVLTFLHPTVPGDSAGGWKTMPNAAPQAPAPAVVVQKVVPDVKKFTMEEVKKHNKKDDCWFVVNNSVYDVTTFIKDHPAGPAPIYANAGTDATAPFEMAHGLDAYKQLENFKIGEIGTPSVQKVIATTSSVKKFTMEEVKKHNKKDDCWFTVNNSVYDVTSFIKDHPAGPAPIWANAGTDATAPFEMAHGEDAYKQLENFKIGEIGIPDGNPVTPIIAQPTPAPTVALHPKEWLNLELKRREDISRDTRILTFKRDKKDLPFGLPVGQYVIIGAVVGDKLLTRSYTPVSPILENEDNGEVQFLFKMYFPQGANPGGKMTMFLEKMEIGQTIKLRGPFGHVSYEGNSQIVVHGQPLRGTHITMIAGGSGITPCYQVIKKVCEDPNDKTEMSLIFSNKSIDDILLRKELDSLAEKNKNFKLWYVVNTAPQDWKYSIGRITYDIIKEHAFPSSQTSWAFLCGPPAMLEEVCVPSLEKLGFDSDNIVEF